MPESKLKIKWGKEEFDVTVEEGSTVEVFKTQVWTLTNVPVDRQKYLGFPGGLLKDTDDLGAKLAKLKPGAKITLMGTAEGGELKAPTEKVVFEEDLSPEEKAKILKEKKVEVPPAGIKNLGNTCYMNATVQCLNRCEELREAMKAYVPPAAQERDIDATLTSQFKSVCESLTNTTDSIVPMQFVMALRQKYPRFAEMQNGGYMQQDADECLRVFLQAFSTAAGSKIDNLFNFQLTSTLKCLECDEEMIQSSDEMQKVLICHLGTQTEPVSHIHQGIALSLKEHIEKNSPILGRSAQYEKSSAISSLPNILLVQFARFGFKAKNDWAGTSASKVKLTRKCAFAAQFDIYDCATPELKKVLTAGRVAQSEQMDAKIEAERKAAVAGGDVEMKPAEDEAAAAETEEISTGYYELVSIISHKGRTADGGHYVAWTMAEPAKGKKEARWVNFDDDTVSFCDWKDMMGLGTDLQGGKVDTQIAYINIYKKLTVKVDKAKGLAAKEQEAATNAAARASSGEAATAAASASSGDAAAAAAPASS